ncbi:hypothetical protein [Limimaricola cinnabarinus]|uniref:hypothetical protein n=1 Tax=Limimaricola cinnabarinus TaxID=1125964 RepID=UPI0024914825|nr:hypothetical protein [Limimaricola cinnabarinus]
MKIFASCVSILAMAGSLAMADGRTHVSQISTARASAYIIQADRIPRTIPQRVRQTVRQQPSPAQLAAAQRQQQQRLQQQQASQPTPKILELERIDTRNGPVLPRARLTVQ